MADYVAEWHETEPMPGHATAGGSTVALSFDKARANLVRTLADNLGRWTLGLNDGQEQAYLDALDGMTVAAEPANGILSWRLRNHELLITRKDLYR